MYTKLKSDIRNTEQLCNLNQSFRTDSTTNVIRIHIVQKEAFKDC